MKFKELQEYLLNEDIKKVELYSNNYLDIFKKWKGDNIYIHFSDYENTIMAKNAKIHKDPTGIYVYPIKYIKNNLNENRFASDRKFVKIFKDISKNPLDLNNLNIKEFQDIIDFFDKHFPNESKNMRSYANNYLMKNSKGKDDIRFAKAVWYAIRYDYNNDKLLSPIKQRKRIIDAGFDSIKDLSRNKANSIITADFVEPQIIFLTYDSFKQLDLIEKSKKTENEFITKLIYEIANSLSWKVLKYKQNENFKNIIFLDAVYDSGFLLSITNKDITIHSPYDPLSDNNKINIDNKSLKQIIKMVKEFPLLNPDTTKPLYRKYKPEDI